MQTVRLGRTDLQVNAAGLGCGGVSKLGRSSGASVDHQVRVIETALDEGVNLIDTAQKYFNEEVVAQALRGKRDQVIVSTKISVNRDGTPDDGTELIDGDEFRRQADATLKRLATDYVDILHLHVVYPHQYDHCVRELLPVMEELRAAGKIRFNGLTERYGTDYKHEMLTRAVADRHFDVIMLALNIFNQTALKSVLPQAKANDLGTMGVFAVRGPLARIESALKLLRKLVESGEIDAADLDPDRPLDFLLEKGVATTLPDAAFRFTRHAPGIDMVLFGTGNIEHVREDVASLNSAPLPVATLERLHYLSRNVMSDV
jgi:L-galactose dehydrogenase